MSTSIGGGTIGCGRLHDQQNAHSSCSAAWNAIPEFIKVDGSLLLPGQTISARQARGRLLDIGRERTRIPKRTHVAKIREILKSLRMQSDVYTAMHPWQGKLQPKEECIILSEQQDWKVAMDLFSWFSRQEGYIPNIFRYNIMFKILGKHHEWDLLNDLWNRMSHDGVRPTNVTFSTIINAHTKAGLTEQGIKWFGAMLDENIQPDEVTLNTMINLYKLSGLYSEAELFSKKFLFFPEDIKTLGSKQPLNVDTYNLLIDLYGKSGRLAEATSTFERMMLCGIRPNTVTFNTMIHICGTHNRLKEAEALFEKMEEEKCKPDVGTYNILIALQIKAENIQAVKNTFSRMKRSLSADAVTYRTLIRPYSSRGLVGEVESLLKEMEQGSYLLSESSIVHLAQMYIEAGLDAKASHYFDRLKLCKGLNNHHLLPLIDAHGERGSWEKAEDIFFSANNLGLTGSSLLYNVMIKAYSVGKRYQKAFDLFESMREAGVEADVATYNSMIHTASNAGELVKAALILSNMKLAGYKPHYSSYTALVVAYGKAKMVAKARSLFEEMKEDYPLVDMVAFSAMVNVYADAGMLKEAETTLNAMEAAGYSPNCTVYTALMKLYGKLDFVEQAERTFRKIESLPDGPDIYARNSLLDIYGKAGMHRAAWTYFQKIQTEGFVNVISCNIILTNLANESGWDEEALFVARKMLKDRLLTDVVSFNNAIGVFTSNGKPQEALELFKEMINQGVMPDLRTHKELKDILENPGLLREAIEELMLVCKEGTNNTHTLVALTSLYSLAGLPGKSMEACAKLMESGLALTVTACNSAINAYGSNGQFDVAVRIFMDMQSQGLKPNVVSFTSMLLLYGKAGLVEGVTRLFTRMKREDCLPDEATFSALIRIYRNAGRFDLVSMATHEMKFVSFLKENRGSLLSEDESLVSEEEDVS